jgi:hypothetical protein
MRQEAEPVPLVLDLRIDHDRFGSSSDPNLNGKSHWPIDIDKSLNETNADKIRKYRDDYNHNPPNATPFMPTISSTSDRFHSDFIRILFLHAHRETDRFFFSFRISVRAIKYGNILPLSSRGFLFDDEFTCFFDSCQNRGFTYYSKSGRGAYHF